MIIDRDNIKIFLIILVVGIGLGYAYINSDLNINGTAQINHANWDVHWANVQVSNGSVTGTNVVTPPTISNGTTVNYSVILPTPGSYYEFTVDAINGGSIDAMIDTIDSKLNGAAITTLPAYLKYEVTYSDGAPLEPNHELKATTTEKYKVRIEYNTDIELNQLPASNQTLSLQFTVTYRQSNENSQVIKHYLYRLNDEETWPGTSSSSMAPTYSTYQEATSEAGQNFFLRHGMKNNKIVDTSVGFIYNSNLYYLMADPRTIAPGDCLFDESYSSPVYSTNKATLLNAFGSSKCSINSSCGGNCEYIECSSSSFHAKSYSYGDSTVWDTTYAAGDEYFECMTELCGYSTCNIAA